MDRETFDRITPTLPERPAALVQAAARVLVDGFSVEQSAQHSHLSIAALRPVLQDYYAGSGMPTTHGIYRCLIDACGDTC